MVTVSDATYLQVLGTLLAEERPLSAYYYGYARIDVLRLLMSALPPGSVQAMSMAGDLAATGKLECQLKGVVFWDEGGHAAELMVRDYRWSSTDQLKKVVEWGGRHPPRVCFFAGDAVKTDQHDAYAWETRNGCLIGRQKASQPELWRSLESLNQKRYEMARAHAEQ